MSGKKFDIQHLPFMGLVLLIAGFSLYGVVNSSVSLNKYVSTTEASVIGAENVPDGMYVPDDSPKLIFQDVSEDHENAVSIGYFKKMGYVAGYDDGTFRPSNLVSRAEFMRILSMAIDADFAGGVYEKCFKDIKSEWFAADVCYASKKGWVSGYEDGTFRPNQNVSRVELLRIAFSAMGVKMPSVDGAPFVDVQESDWYASVAKLAKDEGVIKGKVFLPGLKLSRAATVELLYDVLKSQGKI